MVCRNNACSRATYASIYTSPDQTKNHSAFVNLAGNHALSDDIQLSGNAYYRRIRTATLNGDMNDDSFDQSVYQPSAAERGDIDRGRLQRLPDQRRNGGEYPVPVLALHRQRAAARTSRPRNATAC
jgi:hypothetical protein